MAELSKKDALSVLNEMKRECESRLAKAYDSYCLFPNPDDQRDWDEYSARGSALEMAISALQNFPTQISGTSLNAKVIRSDAIDRFSVGEIDLEDFIKYFGQLINDDTSDLISRRKVIKTINDWYDGRFKKGEEVKTQNRDNSSRDEDGSGFMQIER